MNVHSAIRSGRLAASMFLCLAVAGAPGAARADEDQAAAAQRCQTCHQGPLSLAKYGPDELASRIKAVRGGELAHPPLLLDEASDADIAAIAALLAEG